MMKNITAEINLLRAEIARLQHVLDEARAEIDTANEDGRALRCMMMPNAIATEAATMPRIAWFVISYAVAVALAVSMRSAGYDQFAILIAALAVWIILPFVISKACALFILGRMHRHVSRADGLAEKTTQATKGSPPVERVASLAQHISSEFIRRAKAGARTIVKKSGRFQRAIAMLSSRLTLVRH